MTAPFARKKGGLEVGKTKKGKGTNLMLMTEGHGITISAFTTSASDAEVNTIETRVDIRVTKKRPARLLYDKAADADWMRDAHPSPASFRSSTNGLVVSHFSKSRQRHQRLPELIQRCRDPSGPWYIR